MILHRPLTAEEQRRSQRNYLVYNAVNGVSYTCLGETILILFAVNLGCSDAIVAALGCMMFFGYTLLPLGKIMTARVGASGSQANFWVFRNVAALLVASAAPVMLTGHQTIASTLLVVGAFLFYGFRAAGVVMSQPLIGEITTREHHGGFISRSWTWFYSCGLVALLIITGLRRLDTGIWMLFGIIVVGTLFGFTSAGIFRRIDETGQIQELARKPVWNAMKNDVQTPVILHQLIAGHCTSLTSLLVVPISMLALKRGYGVDDSTALVFSLVQFAASIALSEMLAHLADRFGGRRCTLGCFYGLCAIVLIWVLAPTMLCWPLMVLVFLLCPCGPVGVVNSLQHHFLLTVEKKQQVSASMAIAVGSGATAGIVDLWLSNALLWAAERVCGQAATLTTYRLYFSFVLLLLPALGFLVHRKDVDHK